MFKKFLLLLMDPPAFFERVRKEGWKPALIFFLEISVILSIFTAIANYLGVESTDFSSAYQAQILAYRILRDTLLPQYGVYAYFLEVFLILGFAVLLLLFLTGFSHLVFRLMGGKGSILNGWKASCYGVGPCLFGGFLPFISLFAAFYSALLQLYIGPKTLYTVKESRAIVFLAIMLALTFIEMFARGTTAGFFSITQFYMPISTSFP